MTIDPSICYVHVYVCVHFRVTLIFPQRKLSHLPRAQEFAQVCDLIHRPKPYASGGGSPPGDSVRHSISNFQGDIKGPLATYTADGLGLSRRQMRNHPVFLSDVSEYSCPVYISGRVLFILFLLVVSRRPISPVCVAVRLGR